MGEFEVVRRGDQGGGFTFRDFPGKTGAGEDSDGEGGTDDRANDFGDAFEGDGFEALGSADERCSRGEQRQELGVDDANDVRRHHGDDYFCLVEGCFQ